MKSFRQLVSQSRPQSVVKGRPSMPVLSGANKTTLLHSFRSLAYKENVPSNVSKLHDRTATNGASFQETQLFKRLIKDKDSTHQDQKKVTQGHLKKRIKINRKFVHDFAGCGSTPLKDFKDQLSGKQTAVAQITCQKNPMGLYVGRVTQLIRDRLTDKKVSEYSQLVETITCAQELTMGRVEEGFGKILLSTSFVCSSIKKKLKERSHDEETPRFQLDIIQKVQDTDRMQRSLIKTMDQVLQRVFIHPSEKLETVGSPKLSRLSLLSVQKTCKLGQMQSTRDIKNRLTLTSRSNNSTHNI